MMRTNIETSGGKDTRNPGQDTRLVLYETVEGMPKVVGKLSACH